MVSSHLFSYRAVSIIAHPTEKRILLLSTQEGWSLPQVVWEATEWSSWTEVARLNQEMQQQLGLELTTVRCLSDRYDGEATCFSRVYVMEFHSSVWTMPVDAQWIDAEGPVSRNLTTPEYRTWLEQWLTDHDEVFRETERVPWYSLGWFVKAATWIEKQFEQLEVQVVAPLEQLRVGERGCLLRVRTTEGMFYFKALPPFFAHELSLLQYLAEDYPGHVPDLVVVDTDARWMLMRDFGDDLLSQREDLEDWEEALRRYAALQIDQVEQVEHLLALGCPRLSVETLSRYIDVLLADKQALLVDSPMSLSEDDLLGLHHLLPLMRSMCQQLAHSPIPYSLEHGDFYAQNIAVTGAGADYLYFDWTDSCIAHPFFSLYPFLLGSETRWPSLPNVRQRLRDAYLQPWERFASNEQLIIAFEIAQKLAPLYLASLYYFLIIPNMQAKWEMQNGVPYNLRVLLERMRDEKPSW